METVHLTRPERVVATAVAALLLAGSLTAARSEPDGPRTPAAAPTAPSPPAVEPVADLPPVPPAPPLTGCPPPPREAPSGPPRAQPPPAVADDALPAPLPPGPKAASLDAVAGKGIWVTNFADDPVDVAGLVQRATANGLDSVWVRTGGRTGFYGDRVLPALVPAAHAAGLRVVAWDFPYLSDPVADARRAQQALALGVDAFAPDVETRAEGTYATAQRVTLYLSLVRSYAGTTPVAATVPRPTDRRLAEFPYAAFAPYADVFVPMVYWSCDEPGELLQQSLDRLSPWLPVAPVGQAYDMGSEGGRRGLPSAEETTRFLDVARRGGAVGVSLWTIEQTGDAQMGALRDYPWP